MGESTKRPARNGAIQHLREALEAEDVGEKNYHIKEAVQLLDVDAYTDANR